MYFTSFFYIFGYFQLFTTMFKLLVILFIIKMYARNNILTTLYGENSSSDHAQIKSRNRVKITVKVAYNMETVKILKLTKIYG